MLALSEDVEAVDCEPSDRSSKAVLGLIFNCELGCALICDKASSRGVIALLGKVILEFALFAAEAEATEDDESTPLRRGLTDLTCCACDLEIVLATLSQNKGKTLLLGDVPAME